MALKLFGSPVSPLDVSTKLESLTISGRPEELRLLADFLAKAADDIETDGPHFQHREFSTEPEVKNYAGSLPEIFVSQCV